MKNLISSRRTVVLFLLSIALLVAASFAPASENALSSADSVNAPRAAVARVWHGRTQTGKADEYYAYLREAAISKIQGIAGNVGVQVLRRTTGDVTEFTVISYWDSLESIKRFAGDDIEKTHHLPRDPEYLLELEPTVKHHQVLLNDWKR